MNDRANFKAQREAAPLMRRTEDCAGKAEKPVNSGHAGVFKTAAATVAAALVMTGCGTTPPPEPEGERIWVNFPVFEKTSKTVNAPITDPNASGNRVVVNQVKMEAGLPKELADLRAAEAAKKGEPDLRMRPEQPVPTPPVTTAPKVAAGESAETVKASDQAGAVPAEKTTALSEQKAYIVAVPAATVVPAIVIDQQQKKAEAEERRRAEESAKKPIASDTDREKDAGKDVAKPINNVEVKADIRASIDINAKKAATPEASEANPVQIEKPAATILGVGLTSVDRIHHEAVDAGVETAPTPMKATDPSETAASESDSAAHSVDLASPSSPDKEEKTTEKSEKSVGNGADESSESASTSTLSKLDPQAADPQASGSDSDMKAEPAVESSVKAAESPKTAPKTPVPQANGLQTSVDRNSAGVEPEAEIPDIQGGQEPGQGLGKSAETQNPVQNEPADPTVTPPSESDSKASNADVSADSLTEPALTAPVEDKPADESVESLIGAETSETPANP